MKKILSVLLTLTMMMTLITGMAFADPGNGNGNGKFKGKEFKDIKGHWGMETIMKMQALGILKGYDDDTFRPENTLTQAELAVIVDRLVEQKLKSMGIDDKYVNDDDDDDDEDFDNVPAWAKKSVKKGFKHGYFNVKRFHSHVQVDRLQACVAIAKALEDAGLLKVESSYDIKPFKDKGLFKDADDYRYIMALYKAGYIKGNPDGNFNPNSFLNRAHMASIIANLIDGDNVDSDDKEKPEWDKDSRITASAITADSVTLKWSAASDNEGVTGYKVMYELNDKDKVKDVNDGRTVKITGLEANTEYEFVVLARDAAGNWSEDELSVEVTTLEEDESNADIEQPYWVSGSTIDDTEITVDSIALEWDAAKDDVAVKGYEVKVYSDGKLFDKFDTADNDIVVKNLDDDTAYTFQVRAYDEAGNKSIRLTAVYTTLSK